MIKHINKLILDTSHACSLINRTSLRRNWFLEHIPRFRNCLSVNNNILVEIPLGQHLFSKLITGFLGFNLARLGFRYNFGGVVVNPSLILSQLINLREVLTFI